VHSRERRVVSRVSGCFLFLGAVQVLSGADILSEARDGISVMDRASGKCDARGCSCGCTDTVCGHSLALCFELFTPFPCHSHVKWFFPHTRSVCPMFVLALPALLSVSLPRRQVW
jgi:hypothetical protein